MKYISTVLSLGLASVLAACRTTIIVYETTATDGVSNAATPSSFPDSGVTAGAGDGDVQSGTVSDTTGFVPTAGMADHDQTTAISTTSSGADTMSIPDGTTASRDAEDSDGASDSTGPEKPAYACGNWLIEPGEACDDGPPGQWLDGCENCERSALFAFVTSPTYEGGSLTLEWADSECAALGGFIGFPIMTWRAWLSDGDDDTALERVGSTSLPYIMRKQGEPPVMLVNNSQQTASGMVLAPFNIDESGSEVGNGGQACEGSANLVWTWTTSQGTASDSCEKNVLGMAGSVNDLGPGWTELCTLNCAQPAHLYCIEHGSS